MGRPPEVEVMRTVDPARPRPTKCAFHPQAAEPVKGPPTDGQAPSDSTGWSVPNL